MDLMKLWSHSKQEIFNIEQTIPEKGKKFFSELGKQLEKDIQFLKTQKDLEKNLFFHQLKVSCGSIELDPQNKELIKDYIFIYIPGDAGFLIEPNQTYENFYLFRATKLIQQVDLGKSDGNYSPLFILKSGVVEEFTLLDDNYIRVIGNNKTLSIKQTSEMLLLLADSMQ
ncbi:hypothetical protein QEJ31_15685 [Pigmentibacter sp. JX0631]|uniref:hypothetical protein n=1 Tax=Pigmentibacter sp. JX0631 TaxID=2976982 RepID=UPI002468E970|nr:hypothetical protein [Pigmentibacter sp. JX0631]WGL59974.1 hypothetical protein QEJ31_15685 [Pigmentibacter sp. JX0631]